jgi:SAM-dependent methyltransferase
MAETIHALADQRTYWDQWHERHTLASHSDHSSEALATFIGALPRVAGANVLEIGCGQGREAVQLALRGLRVSAFDHSHVAIACARRNASKARVNLDLTEQDTARPLPYDSEAFLGAFAHLSLHYFDETTTRGIFSEIARVVAPGGILFFTVRSVHDDLYGQGDEIGHNLFCLKGHVRHFFDINYITETLSADWKIRIADSYDTSDRTVNPGVFMKVLAERP